MSLLAAVLLLCALPARQDPPAPPAPRELDALVASYLEQDGRTPEGYARRRQILERLALLEPLRATEAKSWSKKILKAAAGAFRELDGGERRQYWWAEERRGLFLVGGQTRKPKGLLIAMHGGGAGSGDAEEAYSGYQAAAKELGWALIAPQVLELTEHGWTDSGTEEFVLDLIDAALQSWQIDPGRVFLAGHSMGGYGSWTLGAHHADRIAALAPSAGAPTPFLDARGEVDGIADGVVPNLHNVPMIIFQSRDDPQVPPQANQAAVAELKKAQEKWGGYPFEYWEIDGNGHGHPPGGMIAMLEKIAKHRRQAVPDRVVWEPRLAWKRQFYWLYWPERPRRALVTATRDPAANAVHLEGEGRLDGLEVLLDERVVDPRREIVITVNGKEAWRGGLQHQLGTLLLTGAQGDPELLFAMRVPVPTGG